MNSTPRALNRILLGLFGLVLMAAGAAAAAAALIPEAARTWRAVSSSAAAWIRSLGVRGGEDWLWILLALVFLLLATLMIIWLAVQGRGRTGDFLRDRGQEPGEAAGTVTITAAAAEQALKVALQDRRDLVNAAVTTWRFRGTSALRIRVYPRQGAAPARVAEEVAALVEALDAVLGHRAPVLISISAGARARFTHADRVS
ncbi:hypothetical protein [Arthrobacter zhaoguopingii]|uniref:hypothetical protein n=1 Tax=Arthrobacter zhaoguopingii TaxID=2681491 RepID=UPI00135C09A0|nr:hypothetical protein [Arthrobacter zhaoguopingii]